MEYKIPKLSYKGKVGGEVVPQWLRKPKAQPGIQDVPTGGKAHQSAQSTNAAALGALESGGAVVPASKAGAAPAAPAPTHGTFRRQGAGMDLRTGEESKGALDEIAKGVQGGNTDDESAEASSSAKRVAESIREQASSDQRRGPLIQEVDPSATDEDATSRLSTEHTTAAATGMAPRRSRKLAAGPKPVAVPLVFAKAAVALLYSPPAGAVEGAPPRCEAWSYDKWDLIPLNYTRGSSTSSAQELPYAVRVTWQCDSSHPQLMAWATGLRRTVEAAAPVGGRHLTTLAAIPSLQLSVGEETVALTVPGHRETASALPVVLDVAKLGGADAPVAVGAAAASRAHSGGMFVSVDVAAAVVTLTLPVVRVDPGGISGPDPGSRPWLVAAALDGGDDAGAASDITSVAAARYKGGSADTQAAAAAAAAARAAAAANAAAEGPVADDEVLPEDKFHKSDAMSQHYLAQRAQAAAEAEAKRAANARPDPYEGLDFKARVRKATEELIASRKAGEGGAAAESMAAPPPSEDTLQCFDRVFQMI